MKIERYQHHTVLFGESIMYYYIFEPKHSLQITIYENGKFKDTNFPLHELALYSSTDHFKHLVFVYCIPNENEE
ncbi:hypothetical protein A4_487 [Escherichia phage A4]|nr:hypothetical protein A4_487 [Escherichia phage A4]